MSRRREREGPTAHVLLVQEFGSNLGHINRLLAAARALPPHRYSVVVPNPVLALPRIRQVLGPDVPVLPAPVFSAPGISWPPPRPELSFGDIFHAMGFAQADPLARAAAAWRDLLDTLRPDLVISDFAATFRLGNARRIPTLSVGDCFNLLPRGADALPILPGLPADPQSARHEDELVQAACDVARRLGSGPVERFADLFAGDQTFPLGIRLLDPYAALRTGPERPSISIPAIRSGPAVAARTGPAIFCYLWHHHPALSAIVSALNRIAVPSHLYVRGIDPAVLAPHCAPQVGVRTEEADFREVLPQARLFIHYGGGGATFAGLLAGTVQVILPTVLEQESSGARLARAGTALAMRLDPQADPDAIARHIAATLEDTAKQQAALLRAAEVAALPPVDTLGEIRAAAGRLLQR